MLDQLEWGDHLVAQGRIGNPPGFYVYLIRSNVVVPPNFETSRTRALREEADLAAEAAGQERARLQLAYERYCEAEVDCAIRDDPEEYERLRATKQQEFLGRSAENQKFRPEMLDLIITGAARAAVKQRLVFTTFAAFCQEQQAQRHDGSSAPIGGEEQGTERPFVV